MKIAVCDDDKAAREHIVTLIKEQIQGAEIVTFENGEEMLKSQGDFDISFLDVEMKELSGMDVAKHIRQRQEEKGSSKSIIIFVTGYGKYMNDAFDVSAFHYLLKPINEDIWAGMSMHIDSIIIKNTEHTPKNGHMKRYRWIYMELPVTVIAVLIGMITSAWSPYAPIIILFCCLLVTTCKLLIESRGKDE